MINNKLKKKKNEIMLTVFSLALSVRKRNIEWMMSKAYTGMNKWWEYQKVLYPVTRRTDLGSEGEWRRGHFVASENAMVISITITMPVATSVVANISMYDG